MTSSDKIAVVAVGVSILTAFLTLGAAQLYRVIDKKVRVKARLGPHILWSHGQLPIHGIGIFVKSEGPIDAAVACVRLRIPGIDVAKYFMAGFSGSLPLRSSPRALPGDSGVDIEFLHVSGGVANPSSSDHRPIMLKRHEEAIFFAPLPAGPIGRRKR